MTSVSPVELGVEKGTSERATLRTMPSLEPKPWRRVRPRKNKEKMEEDHFLAKPSVCLSIEGPTMLTNWSELVGTTSRGGGRRKRREKSPGTSVKSPAQ
jgi:hypothetical protein